MSKSESPNELDFTPGRPIRTYGRDGTFYDYSTDDLVGDVRNSFFGWRCGIGVDSLFIDMDGKIWGASCRLGGEYGNIYADFETPKEWSVCDRSLCTCGADLFIPKYKEAQDKSLLAKTLLIAPQEKPVSKKSDAIYASERTHGAHQKQVHWEIGRRCNYDCSYCAPFIHNKTDAHKTLPELITATDKIFTKFARGQKVNFVISGGEPTLNPAFMDWVKYISSKGHSLSMHSNGSRLPEYYRELVHYGNLNLSVHFEFYTKEKFVRTVAAITEEKVKHHNVNMGHLEVKAMMFPGRREETLLLKQELDSIPFFKEYCTFAFVPVRDLMNGDVLQAGYTAEDHALFGV